MNLFLLFVFMVVVEGAFEGDTCDVYEGRGICKNIKKCPTALQDIRRNQPPPTCGFDGKDIIVCCKTSSIATKVTMRPAGETTTEYIPEEEVFMEVNPRNKAGCAPIPSNITAQPTGRKAWDKCLEYQEKYVFPCEKSVGLKGDLGRVNRCHHNADKLIIDGKDAAEYEFPHMVLLGYKNVGNKKYPEIDYQCGGSLISDLYVLTAGHCTSDTSHNAVSHALVGVLRRSDESPSNRYEIKRIIPHELYHSPEKYHDIALLELDRPVRLDHTTVPACLHTGEPVDASLASATGWGTTHINRQVNADVLQKVILTKFQSRECASEYASSRHMQEGYQEASQICYGDRTRSQDTCSGDSGGPLQVKNKKIVCMYTIVGVTSFGQACGWVGVPGIYTRVANYLPWIESIVWPD